MRRKWWLVIILIAVVAAFAALLLSVKPGRDVSVTFLCYTQDLRGFRTSQYRVPYNGADSMAVFRLEKRGTEDYVYTVRTLELKSRDGWVTDTNAVTVLGAGLLSDDPTTAPFSSNIMYAIVPRPLTTLAWRCRIGLIEIPRRGGWKSTARKYLSRVGLHNPTNFTRFEVVSGEIER
jgi:hypothetical protein